MKICVLGSGSSGNCIFVASNNTKLLIDAGLSGRDTENRLKLIGESLSDISAICISHEHSDHTAGLSVLCNKYQKDVYLNRATADILSACLKINNYSSWHIFERGNTFNIGELSIYPFSVSHDASDPVGFLISDGKINLGIATDLGCPTGLVIERLRKCNVVILEFNHDETLLKNANRPWDLKQRILGRRGHLSNTLGAELLKAIIQSNLYAVFLAHISEECNTINLALESARKALKEINTNSQIVILPTYRDRPSEVLIY